jgi:hypothetical protein
MDPDRPVVSRPTAPLDPSPLQWGSAGSDLAIFLEVLWND